MQEEDYKWFLTNYSDIYKQYGKGYVAIKNQKIIGHYDSFVEAVNTTKKSEEMGTFIVQKCNGTESAYTDYIASIDLIN